MHTSQYPVFLFCLSTATCVTLTIPLNPCFVNRSDNYKCADCWRPKYRDKIKKSKITTRERKHLFLHNSVSFYIITNIHVVLHISLATRITAMLKFQTETKPGCPLGGSFHLRTRARLISACRSDATRLPPVVVSISAFRPRRPLAHDSSIARVTRHCLSSLGHRHHSRHVRLFQASRRLRSFIAKAHRTAEAQTKEIVRGEPMGHVPGG